jgi:hypothetical protein
LFVAMAAGAAGLYAALRLGGWLNNPGAQEGVASAGQSPAGPGGAQPAKPPDPAPAKPPDPAPAKPPDTFAARAQAETPFFTFDGSNGFFASKGAPEDAGTFLSKARDSGGELKCFAFAMSGEWAFLFGHDGFYTSNPDLPACKKLTELQKQHADLKCVAFAPSGGGWTILWGQNGNWTSAGVPDAAFNKISQVSKQGGELRSIAYGPNGAWVLLYDKTGVAYGDVPKDLADVLDKAVKKRLMVLCVAFTGSDWICLTSNGWWTSNAELPCAKAVGQGYKNGHPPKWVAVTPQFVVPQDGMFYVEAKPAFTFKATLSDNWLCPHAEDGTLDIYAPVAPELPGQRQVTTRLFVAGNDKLKAEELKEQSSSERAMLALHIKSDELSPKSGVRLRVEYEGTLCARTLVYGRPPKEVPDLTKEERHRYLMCSTTMDYNDPGFLRWMNDQGLKRRTDEQVTEFAHRVFSYLVKEGTYGGDTSSYEARRPSRVCKSLANDCGGFALLFVAVMRANDVPARTLFGRWAMQQTDSYGQHHVTAEFFVDKSGWVPVDITGTMPHTSEDPDALFGTTDGQFLAFHVDTDLEPAQGFQHAWAQYLLVRWQGTGDFGKDQKVVSKWDVTRAAAKK